MNFKYIVVSRKESELSRGAYYITFDNEKEAAEFLNTEEYDFRIRYLYDCRNGIPNEFFEEWCLPAETEEENISDDVAWDDNLDRFTYITDYTEIYEDKKKERAKEKQERAKEKQESDDMTAVERAFPGLKTKKQQETVEKIADGLSRNTDLKDEDLDGLYKQVEMFIEYAKREKDSCGRV